MQSLLASLVPINLNELLAVYIYDLDLCDVLK